MKYAWLLIGFLLLLSGCNNQPEGDQHVFVGGQINNPETDYVVLSKEDSIIDTLYLNQQNQFGKEYDDLESGIYTFKHSPENQIMYLEPGDSVVIWLNTLDFDRSLNFSGDGAEKAIFCWIFSSEIWTITISFFSITRSNRNALPKSQILFVMIACNHLKDWKNRKN